MFDPLAFTVKYLSLALALWLGFYLVTRSPRSLGAWLAACTLWSLAGFCLYTLFMASSAARVAQPLGQDWIILLAATTWYQSPVKSGINSNNVLQYGQLSS